MFYVGAGKNSRLLLLQTDLRLRGNDGKIIALKLLYFEIMSDIMCVVIVLNNAYLAMPKVKSASHDPSF